MTIKECYEKFGGDYNDVYSRLIKDERIEKYLRKFSESNGYAEIVASINGPDTEEAFRTVHTLKGLALNLSLSPLYEPASTLCEYLRNNPSPIDTGVTEPLLKEIKDVYDKIMIYIKEYLGE